MSYTFQFLILGYVREDAYAVKTLVFQFLILGYHNPSYEHASLEP